jgi:hypothetical protein
MNLSAIRPFTNLINRVPNLNSVYIDTEGGGGFDLNGLVEMARRKRMMQEAGANVAGRRQELREQGMLGYEDVDDSAKASRELQDRMYLLRNVVGESNPFGNRFDKEFMGGGAADSLKNLESKKIPGIGTALRTPDGKTAVVGRYGVGYSTQRDTPDPNRTIEGKPAAQWFAERAGEQGVSNRYATAVPTGVTDKQDPWGVKPRYTGKAIVDDAMNKKKAKA